MSIVYLNGDYMPMEEARISPMDRGFLFGDGIYEVVPSYDGKLVGFAPHMKRMQDGLDAIEIQLHVDHEAWHSITNQLTERNGGGNLGIYFHVSRGADSKLPPAPIPQKDAATPYTVATAEDLRWKRCNIKSTALLGNVMHYQHGHSQGHNETLLYNQDGELTEAAACNLYVIKNGIVATPLLDHQKLPGITRLMLLEILRKDGGIAVQERVVKVDELDSADEVWISSSSKEIAPVIEIDGKPVGDGKVGDVWLAAQTLYSAHKFDF